MKRGYLHAQHGPFERLLAGATMLVAFSNDDNSAEEFRVLQNTLSKGGTQFKRSVGYQGGNDEEEITWQAKADIWSVAKESKNRFWCCFGVQNPKDLKSLDIAVEVNPRLRGTDLGVAGAFARDALGMVHLCHNGRIGGGQLGVGKTAFFEHYRGKPTDLAYRNMIVKVVDLGPIRSRRLLKRLARFAREVVHIKNEIKTESSGSEAALLPAGLADMIPRFVPEFSGVRRPYSLRKVIEAHVDHGTVVDILAEFVEKFGYAPVNSPAIDLFIRDERNRPAVLFEVKTDVRRNSIYAAVGQLLLNGGVADHRPQMVLVVPATPESETRVALRKIGIDVLTYEWVGDRPKIPLSQKNVLENLCHGKSLSIENRAH